MDRSKGDTQQVFGEVREVSQCWVQMLKCLCAHEVFKRTKAMHLKGKNSKDYRAVYLIEHMAVILILFFCMLQVFVNKYAVEVKSNQGTNHQKCVLHCAKSNMTVNKLI
jgi:hypothetical protein